MSAHRYRRRYRFHEIHLNIIPLVDVTFLLMIFFVIAGTFSRWEGVLSSRMFPSDPTRAIPLPMTPVTIRLEPSGPKPEGFLLTVQGAANQPATFEELAGLLAELQKNPAYTREAPVVILSNPRVRWDHVVSAWNAAVRAGYRNVAFGTS